MSSRKHRQDVSKGTMLLWPLRCFASWAGWGREKSHTQRSPFSYSAEDAQTSSSLKEIPWQISLTFSHSILAHHPPARCSTTHTARLSPGFKLSSLTS